MYYAVLPTGPDRLLAMSSMRGVMEIHNGLATPLLQYPDGMNPSCAQFGPDSTILLADRRHVRRFDPRTGLVSSMVSADVEVSCMTMLGDTLWLGTQSSVGYALHGTYYPMVNIAAGKVDEQAFFIRRGPHGLLWFGTASGLFTLDRRTGISNAIPELKDRCVRAMETIGDLVFIGTYGDGAFVISGAEVMHLPLDAEGRMQHIHAFVTDRSGHIRMSTNRGLFRMGRQDVIRWCKDRTTTPTYEYYGAYAGIDNVEFNGGCDPAYARLANGTLCFPTMDGVVQFMPDQVPPLRSNTAVILEHAMVDGVPSGAGFLHFAPNVHVISIPFSTSYWGDPQNMHLQYRLTGVSDEWIDIPSGAHEVVLGNLPPEDYSFHIRSSENETEDFGNTLYFTVDAPWYRSLWAIAFFVVSAIALLAFGKHLISQRLERRNVELELAVAQRTHDLSAANLELERTIEVKDRLFSMLNHDIVSPLKFITRVARGQMNADMRAKPEERTGALRDIAFASDKLHGNAQNLLSWIKQQEGRINPQPRHQVVNFLVEETFDRVRPQAAHKGIDLLNDVPLDDVIKVDKALLSIVLGNLLMNAVNYTQKGMVRISSATVDGVYHLIVMDTGPGFSAEARAQIERIRTGDNRSLPNEEGGGLQGLGYIIIAGMMELMGGHFEIVAESGEGTTIVLDFPKNT